MRRLKWRHADLCLFCGRPVTVVGARRLRVEFEHGYYLSRVICALCGTVFDEEKRRRVSSWGRSFEVTKRDQVGPHRIRGDGTWSCKGVWL